MPLPTIEIAWRRGSYCAELKGPDKRYGLAREFRTDGVVVKTRKVIVFDLEPGYYETREWVTGTGNVRKAYRVTDVSAERIHDGADLVAISSGPAPNAPGSYADKRCACGADVADYTDEGFPFCETHAPRKMTDAEAALSDALIERMTR